MSGCSNELFCYSNCFLRRHLRIFFVTIKLYIFRSRMFSRRKSNPGEVETDSSDFSCRSIAHLSNNCYGFFRWRAYNYYYYESATSEHCEILKTMDSLCGNLQKNPSDVNLQESLMEKKKEYIKLLETNFNDRQKSFKENDVWKIRETPIVSWKSKPS